MNKSKWRIRLEWMSQDECEPETTTILETTGESGNETRHAVVLHGYGRPDPSASGHREHSSCSIW